MDGVRRAKKFTPNVEFSPEDASRTEIDFLIEVVEAAIAAGATTINLPDTTGYATPEEYGRMFSDVLTLAHGATDVILSTHCHNDLGLAVANSLSAVHAGARQVECTLNGIGERAGNAALEEVVMALRTRSDCYPTSPQAFIAARLSAPLALFREPAVSPFLETKPSWA